MFPWDVQGLDRAIRRTVRAPRFRRVRNIAAATVLFLIAVFGIFAVTNGPMAGEGSTYCPAPYWVQWRSGGTLKVWSWAGGRLRYPTCSMYVYSCYADSYDPGSVYWGFAGCPGGGGGSW